MSMAILCNIHSILTARHLIDLVDIAFFLKRSIASIYEDNKLVCYIFPSMVFWYERWKLIFGFSSTASHFEFLSDEFNSRRALFLVTIDMTEHCEIFQARPLIVLFDQSCFLLLEFHLRQLGQDVGPARVGFCASNGRFLKISSRIWQSQHDYKLLATTFCSRA